MTRLLSLLRWLRYQARPVAYLPLAHQCLYDQWEAARDRHNLPEMARVLRVMRRGFEKSGR